MSPHIFCQSICAADTVSNLTHDISNSSLPKNREEYSESFSIAHPVLINTMLVSAQLLVTFSSLKFLDYGILYILTGRSLTKMSLKNEFEKFPLTILGVKNDKV